MSQPMDGHVILVLAEDQLRYRLADKLTAEASAPAMFSRPIDCLKALEDHDADYFCVLCDLDGPGMSGLDLQRRLRGSVHQAMFVFCSEHADMCDVVQAMRDGAVAVLRPSDEQQVMTYVCEALHRCRFEFEHERLGRETLDRLSKLNLGEHQVLQGIMAGKLNKEIAHELNLSTRTIEQRRREVFRKLDVHHPATLARKLIEAAQSPKLEFRHDDQARWLEAIRHDLGHSLPARGSHLGSVRPRG